MSELTNEQKVLLNLLARGFVSKTNLFSISEEILSSIDWKVVYAESIAQAVTLIAFDKLEDYKNFVPEEIFLLWKKTAITILKRNFEVAQGQGNLVGILNEKAYPYIIIKGLASAGYYEKPELRGLGDVDFLIDPNQLQEIKDVLSRAGYVDWGKEHISHVVFTKDKDHLEMHFEVAGIPYGWKGEAVRGFLKDAVFFSQEKDCYGGKFNAPSDEAHGLILLLHMQHHMLGEGFGLRHLSDWAAYVSKTHKLPFWEESLIPFLHKIGLYIYASAMTRICVKYLGIDSPVWLKDFNENSCDEVMQDVFAGGNFGQKDKRRVQNSVLISNRGKEGTKDNIFCTALKHLHRSVVFRYQIVKKIPILYPFLYLWSGVRFLFLSMIGKRPKLTRMLPEAKKRKKIYDKLKIFEV